MQKREMATQSESPNLLRMTAMNQWSDTSLLHAGSSHTDVICRKC